MKKLLKFISYPLRLLRVRKIKNKLRDDKFLKKENDFIDIIDKLLKSDYRKLHCDTKYKKYYVIGEENIMIVVNGNNNKVYLLYTENDIQTPVLYDFRDEFVTKVIHMIFEEKHRESEKIYEKIQEYEIKLNSRILSKI